MIIDCHGHYTTEPKAMIAWRERQVAAIKDGSKRPSRSELHISDDQIRESIESNQLPRMNERGNDVTIISPRASGMGHHIGDENASREWTALSNDMIHRITQLYPQKFVGVCQLPQTPGVSPSGCIEELERCVKKLGFVGCNLNPDPSGGKRTAPPLTDLKWWGPFYEKMVELDVPAMIHVSASCDPTAFHSTGDHYLNADTTAFVQLNRSTLFETFPDLKFIIPHGGGAVPFHWGRFRGLAQDNQDKTWTPTENLLKNVWFDTCVYHQPGIELLTQVIPPERVLYAQETFGAVKGIDPHTNHPFDDTGRYLRAARFIENDRIVQLSQDDLERIFFRNALEAYPRLPGRLTEVGLVLDPTRDQTRNPAMARTRVPRLGGGAPS